MAGWPPPECGFIESVRRIDHSRIAGAQQTVVAKAASEGSGGAVPSRLLPAKDYEITVRFRDGSTTVFHDASARSWRLGSQVIVIAGAEVSQE